MARSLRKIGVLAMALAMVFAMTVGAFAATDTQVPTSGTVSILKDGKTDPSMADDAVVINENDEKAYTATVSADGNTVSVSIPIQKVEKMGFYGYILNTSTITLNGESVPFTVTDAPYLDGGTLTLTLPASAFVDGEDIVSSLKLDVSFELGLYGSGGIVGDHTHISNMNADADIYLFPAA